MTKEMSKRQQRREKMRRQEQRSRLITIGLISVGAILVALFLILPNLPQSIKVNVPEARQLPQTDANTMGDPNAPIRIDEFSDFQCPYCRIFYEKTEDALVKQYVETGKVYFVYNSFGDYIGSESGAAAEAAYCAGDQNKFWEMHDIIFANQTGENIGDFAHAKLVAFARKIKLDMGTFNSCLDGGKYRDKVSQDASTGRTYNIQATPSFVLSYKVNGETKAVLIEGAQPISEFQSKIEAALAEMGQ